MALPFPTRIPLTIYLTPVSNIHCLTHVRFPREGCCRSPLDVCRDGDRDGGDEAQTAKSAGEDGMSFVAGKLQPPAAGGPIVSAWRQNRPLTALAVVMVAMVAVSLVGLAIDPRIITGAPAWMKPLKFAVSIAVYSGTLLWLLTFIPNRPRLIAAGVAAVAVALGLEMVLIVLQVVRGTTSHFNQATFVRCERLPDHGRAHHRGLAAQPRSGGVPQPAPFRFAPARLECSPRASRGAAGHGGRVSDGHADVRTTRVDRRAGFIFDHRRACRGCARRRTRSAGCGLEHRGR